MTATPLLEEPESLVAKPVAPLMNLEREKPGIPPVKKAKGPAVSISNLLLVLFLMAYLPYMLWWAISFGPVEIAGFFAWTGYMSLFTYFLGRDKP